MNGQTALPEGETASTSCVALAACATYDLVAVRAAVEKALTPFGGMKAFVRPGMRVLLKPNLVMAMAVDRAACTHPAMVEVVGQMVLDCGGTLLVGDSPGIHSAAKVAQACGIAAVVERLGGKIVEFTVRDDTQAKAMAGRDHVAPYAKDVPDYREVLRAEMAREIFEADCVINLPKFKSHAMTMMSLGVKNCFGCVVGSRKFQWHYRAGHVPELFGKMLVNVWHMAAPALTILDGIIGMEGQGPTGGAPRFIGLVGAAQNAALLDIACARLVGLEPDLVLTTRMACEMGLADERAICYCGDDPSQFMMPDFLLPPRDRGFHMLPIWMSGMIRRWVTSRPVPDQARCTGCGRCAEICQAKAITMENQLPRINASACIRCYCCHEFCPPHAMKKKTPLFARLLSIGR